MLFFSYEDTHVFHDSCTILFYFSFYGAQIVPQDWCRIEIEKVSDGCHRFGFRLSFELRIQTDFVCFVVSASPPRKLVRLLLKLLCDPLRKRISDLKISFRFIKTATFLHWWTETNYFSPIVDDLTNVLNASNEIRTLCQSIDHKNVVKSVLLYYIIKAVKQESHTFHVLCLSQNARARVHIQSEMSTKNAF